MMTQQILSPIQKYQKSVDFLLKYLAMAILTVNGASLVFYVLLIFLVLKVFINIKKYIVTPT
jgi:hypothetical protein